MGMLNRTVIIGINGWPAVCMHCSVLRDAEEKRRKNKRKEQDLIFWSWWGKKGGIIHRE